jgi:hypothetical protein
MRAIGMGRVLGVLRARVVPVGARVRAAAGKRDLGIAV